MKLNKRERAVLAKLADGGWHQPARLVDSRLIYQQVSIALRRLLELGLVERERVGGGSSRRRFRYRITDAGHDEPTTDQPEDGGSLGRP